MKDLQEIHAEQIAAEAARRLANANADQTNGIALLPCPFCGGEATIEPYRNGFSINHVCMFVDPIWFPGRTDQAAIAAWNTRAERTCSMTYNEDWSGDELYPTEAFMCSECRHITREGKPKYCPNCGAKAER